ncbi:T6SS immunity protein Tdi1 domain-containing protein [Arenibacterium sp. CAU 1754]
MGLRFRLNCQHVRFADKPDLETKRDLCDIRCITDEMNIALDLLGRINEHWGWTGLKGIEIVGRNEFGNFIILGEDRAYWRICPEELTCEIVAGNQSDYLQLIETKGFQIDWNMTNLVELARKHLGSLKKGWVYYLVVPAIFGGRYDETNIRSVPLEELVGHSGDWASAIKDLPDGAQIELRVID